MAFCSNCGAKLNDGAKFCSECGSKIICANSSQAELSEIEKHKNSFISGLSETPSSTVGTIADGVKQSALGTNTRESIASPTVSNSANPANRQQEYAGTILKCPHCGATITHSTVICPDCGMQITGQTAVYSVQKFKDQLMEIESKRKKSHLGMFYAYAPADPVDKQKLELIKAFPIPNTIDDIIEFIMLANANIDMKLSKKSWMNSGGGMQVLSMEMPKVISDAWVAKMQQAYQKAEMLFPNTKAFGGIQKIYLDKMKDLKIKVN